MNKKILITGGSSGIGKGIAKYFHAQGWEVLITGRDSAKLEAVTQELKGIQTLIYESGNEQQILDLVAFIQDHWNGELHALVNNGGNVEIGALEELTPETMRNMFQAHMLGPSLITSKCLDFLKRTKGQILNITSSHGIKAYAQTTAYGAAKAGLNMLTKIWALELAPFGIRVNAIAPGPTNTDILKSAGYDEELILEIHESERSGIPLKRRGEVSDIVANATLLLNSESTWTTGVVLATDGGISIS
ncbi:SDR family NAD(P)-dependent oxidoreductase [Flagellimonas sp.]|uniref:SDR family NAD(P)-dependent oxidoreductase n=1 Tax=Flagellimonas sp. TaxID=2058762 RepID=UPI003AB51C1A